MALHLHCPNCGELLVEEGTMVTTSAREGTRQETYDLACRCGTRLRLQLPPEQLAPPRRRRHGRRRGRTARTATSAAGILPAAKDPPAVLPTAEQPYPFSTWQYARLLMLRGRVQDGEIGEGAPATEEPPAS